MMKRKLMMLGAAMLVGGSAFAQTFTATWTKPAPAMNGTYALDKECYLWNVGAGGFYVNYQELIGASNEVVAPYYSTRASVNDTIGAKVVFTRTNPGGTEEPWEELENVTENTCLLTSYVNAARHKKMLCTFVEAWNSIWTDNNAQANRYVEVTATGNTVKIAGSPCNANDIMAGGEYDFSGKFVSVLAGSSDPILYLSDETAVTEAGLAHTSFHSDWGLVTPEDYEAFMLNGKDKLKAYAQAAKLRAAIENAVAANPGIDLSARVAVYNNTASTYEDLLAATEAVSADIIAFLKNKASVDSPVAFTSALVNPSFDTGDKTGWTFTVSGGNGGLVDASYKNGEVWNASSFDVYQEVKGLPEGIYAIGIQAFYRAGSNDTEYSTYTADPTANNNAKLYGASSLGEVSKAVARQASEASTEGLLVDASNAYPYDALVGGSYYVPNSQQGSELWFDAGKYKNSLFVAVGDDGVLRVGFKKSTNIGDDWCIFDNFTLNYYGASNEAYELYAKEVRASVPSYDFEASGMYYGADAKTAYDDVIDALENSTSKDEILKASGEVASAVDALDESIAAYKSYMDKVNDIGQWLTNYGDEYSATETDVLQVYINEDAEEWANNGYDADHPTGSLRGIIPSIEEGYDYGAGSLDTEQIKAEITYLDNLRAKAIENSLKDGSDLTQLIKNPGFELAHGADGDAWKMDASYGTLTNWRGGNETNHCAEAYQMNFDVYQEIEADLPAGLYELSVQAFYRGGWNEACYDEWQSYLNGTISKPEVPTEVYLNDFAAPVRNVMEIQYEDGELDVLNTNTYATPDGKYTLNGMTSASNAFSLDDEARNFTMKTYGLVTDGKMRIGIRRLTAPAVNDGTWSLWDNFKLVYRAKNPTALKSVINNYVERADELDADTYGKPDASALGAAATTATAAAAGTDGEAMYDALIDLVAKYNTATASVANYAKVDAYIMKLDEALQNYPDASDEAVNNANDLYNELVDLNYALAGAGLPALFERAEAAIVALKMPANIDEASDDNGIDVTDVFITNAHFDTVGDFTGWEGSGFSAGGTTGPCAEKWKAAFNTYQDLKFLPEGTYELSVMGYTRASDSHTTDYQLWSAGDNSSRTLFLYATVNDQTGETALPYVSAGGIESEESEPEISGSKSYSIDASHYLHTPNTMATAVQYFANEESAKAYTVSLIVKVDAGGKMRIGVKEETGKNWCVVDEFKLVYYGKNSEKDPTAIETAATDAAAVSTEIFSISGVRAGSLQRGVNIVKKVLSDGTVKVVKVMVK